MEAQGETRCFFRIVPFCAVACVLLGAFFLGLGGVRLYSLSLENKINELSKRVETAQEEKSFLEVRMAQLVAPSKVHAVARVTLGMCPPLQTVVMSLPRPARGTERAGLPSTLSPSLSPWAGFFVAPADARE